MDGGKVERGARRQGEGKERVRRTYVFRGVRGRVRDGGRDGGRGVVFPAFLSLSVFCELKETVYLCVNARQADRTGKGDRDVSKAICSTINSVS